MRIAIVTATPRTITGLPPEAEVAVLRHARDFVEITGDYDALTVVSDGFDDASIRLLAEAIRQDRRPCIEVRTVRWDGEALSPLSAVCRGVISGFGDSGIMAAARVLSEESAPRS